MLRLLFLLLLPGLVAVLLKLWLKLRVWPAAVARLLLWLRMLR